MPSFFMEDPSYSFADETTATSNHYFFAIVSLCLYRLEVSMISEHRRSTDNPRIVNSSIEIPAI
jgi:hypothetical protein